VLTRRTIPVAGHGLFDASAPTMIQEIGFELDSPLDSRSRRYEGVPKRAIWVLRAFNQLRAAERFGHTNLAGRVGDLAPARVLAFDISTARSWARKRAAIRGESGTQLPVGRIDRICQGAPRVI
jgi:hypothetical protein